MAELKKKFLHGKHEPQAKGNAHIPSKPQKVRKEADTLCK